MPFNPKTGLHNMEPLGMGFPGSSFQKDKSQQAGRGNDIASAERLLREYQDLKTEEQRQRWKKLNQNSLSELKKTLPGHYLFNDLEKLS